MATNSNFNYNLRSNLNQLSLLTSLGCSIILAITLFLFVQCHIIKLDLSYIFLLFLFNIIISFLIIRYVLFGYLRRRLKIIYKLINNANKDQEYPLDKNASASSVFELAERDVENWLKQKNDDQIAMIQLEEYRREYIGNVSHELKTPIFNIQGYIQALIQGGIKDQEVNMKFLHKAMSNADRLQTIVEDLEAISRLESGQYNNDYSNFDIRTLCQEVFEDLYSKAVNKSIKLIYKSEESHQMMVHADREQIRLVLTNIIQNAIKYGKINGFVKVRTYDVDSKILIEVADNGIGIPEESLPKVFERFYRVDKGRSREMGGSGLGLSIVKHIIESHNQSIVVRSTESEGSVFSFTLECAKTS